MDLIWVRGLTPRVSLKFCVPCIQDGDEELKARFFEEKARNAKSAYVHLEGLAKSFSLMCSSLQSGISWTRGLVSCIPKVFLSSAHGDHILTLRPHFFNRNDDF
jgi:ribonuclease BN (tRNA processing enzyme)